MMGMSKIRVLLVEDHAVVREGLRLLLESQQDFDVVGEAGDGLSALEKAQHLQPDVVLMDISMPGMNGLEATHLLKKRHPRIQVLALTGAESDEFFFRALEAGASGYVLKGAAAVELIAAVRTVARGDVFLHPPMARKLVADHLQRAHAGREQDSYTTLTDREREVLQLIAEGHTNQQIAARLTVSPSTVQTHRTHIMEKLGLRSRAELVKYAVDRGLLRSAG